MERELQPLWWVEATATATGDRRRILVQGSDEHDAARNGCAKLHRVAGRIAGEVRVTRADDDVLGGLGRGGPRRKRTRFKVVTRSGLIIGHGDTEAEAIASIHPDARIREEWLVTRATSAGPDGRGPGAPLHPARAHGCALSNGA